MPSLTRYRPAARRSDREGWGKAFAANSPGLLVLSRHWQRPEPQPRASMGLVSTDLRLLYGAFPGVMFGPRLLGSLGYALASESRRKWSLLAHAHAHPLTPIPTHDRCGGQSRLHPHLHAHRPALEQPPRRPHPNAVAFWAGRPPAGPGAAPRRRCRLTMMVKMSRCRPHLDNRSGRHRE